MFESPRIRRRNRFLRRALLTVAVLVCAPVFAQEPFVVRDIRVEGLRRISEGTVFNYLPVNVGDTLDRRRVQEAFRAVYATGFFDNVEFRRDGDTLVLDVDERPAISEFTIKGNKDIKTEDLEGNLRSVGLRSGGTFDRSVLDQVEQVLTQEYFNRGKYGARIDTSVTEIANNQVRIAIEISEGDRARIRQINVVGNETFSDDELLGALELKTRDHLSLIQRVTSIWKKNDRYAREVLSGDLETLTSYYMDRGFANFGIESTQVAISPDKKDMYVTINIDEGERYRIGEVGVSGDMVVPEDELRRLVLLKPGDVFSRKTLTRTTELMSLRLGVEGFSRAQIEPLPTIDNDAKVVGIDFRVDPGQRVYVRRIEFAGTDSIDDEVLRREMRQLEGGWLSNTAVDRSRQRVQRLPFIESVEVETIPVPGSEDLVDLEFEVSERLPGQFGGGLGYSGSQGVVLSGNFTHTNFMGAGDRVSAEVSAGSLRKIYSISHADAYRTPSGIGRNLSLAYSDLTGFTRDSSDFSIKSLNAAAEYSWPLTEYQRIRMGVGYQDAEQVTTLFSSEQLVRFVHNNGSPFAIQNNPGTRCGTSLNDICGTNFKAWELFGGWVWDTRDRVIFPTRGARHFLNVGITMPGSEVEYYTAQYDLVKLWPLWGRFALGLKGEFAFAEALGSTTDLPPSKLFFAGGPDSVRGFENSRLGPIDSRGNPYGGNLKIVSQLELLLPTPAKLASSTRFSLFYDIGNVFYTGDNDIAFEDCIPNLGFTCDPRRVDYRFDESALRQSVGFSAEWLAPLGTFRFSYATPIQKFDGSRRLPEDEIERFQFTVGSSF